MFGRKTIIDSTERFVRLSNRFRKETDGVAAMEFAIIAPLLILLFFGTMEVSTAVAVNRKVSRVSSTIADLVTQEAGELTSEKVADIMRSASFVMKPYEHTVRIVVSQVKVEDGQAKVTDSRGFNASPYGTGSIYPVPASIKIDGTVLVTAKVNVDHTPTIGFFSLGANRSLEKDTSGIPMEEEIFLRPRAGGSVTFD